MAVTYDPIATQTLGSAASTIEFTSITSAYTDLVVVIQGAIDTGTRFPYMRINDDTANNYRNAWLYSSGSTIASSQQSLATNAGNGIFLGLSNGCTTDVFSSVINIMNYSATDVVKTFLIRTGQGPTSTIDSVNAWWNSTNAINKLTFRLNSTGNYVAGTMISLYGILKA